MILEHATTILKEMQQRYPWDQDYSVALLQNPKYGWTVTITDQRGIGFATILVGTEREVAWTIKSIKEGWRK